MNSEQALIAAIMADNQLYHDVKDTLTANSFSDKRHSKIFEIMGLLEEIDEITIGDKANDLGVIDTVGDYLYLSELAEISFSHIDPKKVFAYVKNVKEAEAKRKIAELAKTTNDLQGKSAKDVIDSLKTSIDQIDILERKQTFWIKSIAVNNAGELEKRANERDQGKLIPGLETGFAEFDKITGGLQKTHMYVIAARPSMGKTALAINMATNIAKNGKKVLLFSIEMSKEQIVNRILSSESGVAATAIRDANLTADDYDKLAYTLDNISTAHVRINDNSTINIGGIRSQIRSEIKKHGVDAVFIDYLQIITPSKNIPREQQVSEIARGIKSAAKDFQIPIVALAQLNRALEARTDKRPMLSDLRESGSIEQEADLISFIYREDFYNPEKQSGIADLTIAKHRAGKLASIKLSFKGECTKFTNLGETWG